ncbi:hypothetical protein A4E84_20305 [Streptomyces qaidamensis]|uniref:Uncharacterized protein n=1 Tax=Streptomyces qaidamensis TaxID=1783515 RepID=A0A143C3F2_9ACTN|nr:hypothetical protein [Streptomyces qaidamensis]AMW11629.1 hypothetical protein A4E84_20305 [Streptomyces qaidamensis]
MSTAQPEPQASEAGEQPTKEAVEPGERAERIARLVLTLVAGLALWGVLAAFPYVAYVVVGVLATLGWQRSRAALRGRRSSEGETAEDAPPPDVGAALRRLVGDDNGVLLTRLRDDLKLPDTRAVKALLKAEGIPWKAGRTREGNGPSVRREAIPPAPSPPAAAPHGDGCCCRSGDNANSNNAPEGEPREGFRVVRIGTDGRIVYDLSDTHLHHPVDGRGRG